MCVCVFFFFFVGGTICLSLIKSTHSNQQHTVILSVYAKYAIHLSCRFIIICYRRSGAIAPMKCRRQRRTPFICCARIAHQ